MSAVKARQVARGRWQLDAPVYVYPCGCRVLTDGDPEYPETVRTVATCRGCRRNVGASLVPWQPAT